MEENGEVGVVLVVVGLVLVVVEVVLGLVGVVVLVVGAVLVLVMRRIRGALCRICGVWCMICGAWRMISDVWCTCVQGVSRHWTPENLAKSQALYKIRHLENIQVSNSRLKRIWDLA